MSSRKAPPPPCSAKVTAYATGYGRRLSSLPAPGRTLTAYATSYG